MLGESRWKGVTVKRTEAEKLLGGHATGILTLEERKILFAAALERQDIFDALADEEALRELLADPAAREALLAALAPAATPKVVPFWRRTGVLGAAASLLVAATAGLVYLRSPAKLPPPLPQASSKAPAVNAAETLAAAPPAELVRKTVPNSSAKDIAAKPSGTAASVPSPPPPSPPSSVLSTAGAQAASVEERTRAQAEFRRAEAQDKLARKAESPWPTAALMEVAGAMAPSPSAAPPAKALAKAKAGGAARQDAAAMPVAPRWALEAQPEGTTRVTITAPRAAQVVLLRRGSLGNEVLKLRAVPAAGEEAMVLWRGEVHLAAGDALDLYLLKAPVADPAQLPATGPMDGYRVRIHPPPRKDPTP